MSFERVAIIGTDTISVSIALGLKNQAHPPEIIGYDATSLPAKLAHSQGAFDRVERKPERACRGADLVIVAEPLTAIRETLATIAPHLDPGCLVTDTACLQAPVMHWAEELLPPNTPFFGGHPIPNPAAVGFTPLESLDRASADLLTEALYFITIPTGFSATERATEMIKSLGAYPYFIDAAEHDGLHAGAEGLPDLLAIALLRATVDTPGWREMRNLAGRYFAAATQVAGNAAARHTAIFLNRENVRLRLDILLNELLRLRDLLSQDEAEPIEQAFIVAAEGRETWLQERERGMWTREPTVSREDVPTLGQQLGQMLLGGMARKQAPARSRQK